jgi:NNP family nitrate/nitrite transporter-like MFS transporter
VIFFLAGVGNGSTYRMIPSIFNELGRRKVAAGADGAAAIISSYKRQTAAVIGIAGAAGAFGGFLIQVVFRQASLGVSALMTKASKLYAHDKVLLAAKKHAIALTHADWSLPALWVFLGAYVALAGMTWFFYIRRSEAAERMPSLAHAAV